MNRFFQLHSFKRYCKQQHWRRISIRVILILGAGRIVGAPSDWLNCDVGDPNPNPTPNPTPNAPTIRPAYQLFVISDRYLVGGSTLLITDLLFATSGPFLFSSY